MGGSQTIGRRILLYFVAESDARPNIGAKSTLAGPEDEPLPFDRDVADILEQYQISRDQWHKETIGGELAAVTFARLIDEVDDKVRATVLKIPAPEVYSANLALKQVLSNRQSGLKLLSKWSEEQAAPSWRELIN